MIESLLSIEYLKMTNQAAHGKRQKLLALLPGCVRHLMAEAMLKKYVHDPKEDDRVFLLDLSSKTYPYHDILVTGKHLFEDKLFSVPAGYENVLKTQYGDYMTLPPEDQRGGHDSALGEIINDVHMDYKQYQEELRSGAWKV